MSWICQRSDKNNWIKNLTTEILLKDVDIISLGPNYSLKSGLPKNNVFEIIQSVETTIHSFEINIKNEIRDKIKHQFK